MKIKLNQVIQAMEEANDFNTLYYDTKEEKTVYVSDEFFTDEQDTALEELIESDFDRYLRFPDNYEIHEYSIMERYIDTLPSDKAKAELACAICGKGAFRRFKDTLYYHGLEQQWYDFKSKAFREIAIRWCEDNELEIEE